MTAGGSYFTPWRWTPLLASVRGRFCDLRAYHPLQDLRHQPPPGLNFQTFSLARGSHSGRGMYDHDRLFVRVHAAVAQAPDASLRRIASMLGVHPHTVAVVVRARTGCTFSSWRTGQRLAASRLLLRTRADLSIKEIAAVAGFSSTSVFDRFIRRTCGRSPSACRLDRDDAADAGSNVNAFDDQSTLTGSHRGVDDGTLESSTASS